MLLRRLLPLALLASLTACDQVAALLELPDPGKEAAMQEAEGKAIGGACRQTGRSVEDCYALNPKAPKAAVFAGWREMNDYMTENKIEVVTPTVPTPEQLAAQAKAAEEADAEPAPEDRKGKAGKAAHGG